MFLWHTYIQTLWLLESLDLLDRETKKWLNFPIFPVSVFQSYRNEFTWQTLVVQSCSDHQWDNFLQLMKCWPMASKLQAQTRSSGHKVDWTSNPTDPDDYNWEKINNAWSMEDKEGGLIDCVQVNVSILIGQLGLSWSYDWLSQFKNQYELSSLFYH